ncbi:MAG: hypothetical protein KDC98_06475 [Planctomycetes bacterium]|nr:hypothetical protein [Planctomycetota bacterium]
MLAIARCCVVRVMVATAAGLVSAQDTARIPERALPSPGAALQWLDGTLVGVGRGYTARFAADGMTYLPAGRVPASDATLQFTAIDCRRGATVVVLGLTLPLAIGSAVEYPRPFGVERYELRPDGVEQSFVFDWLPPGDGDLIVRGTLRTGLDCMVTPGGEVLLRHGERLVASIGAIVGHDAQGRSTHGSMRIENGVLEFRLPAAFVAAAAMPLVLDPLYGSELFVAVDPIDDDRGGAIAAEAVSQGGTQVYYLVVHERRLTPTNHDLLAQRFLADGTPVGGQIVIDATAADEVAPAVARVEGRDMFVVVYQRAENVIARSVAAATGAVGPALVVAGTGDRELRPDVGGEELLGQYSVPCVWENYTQNRIAAAQLSLAGDGSLSIGATRTLRQGLGGTRVTLPRISRSGGIDGRFLVVWQHDWTSPTVQSDVYAALIGRDVAVLGSTIVSGDASWDDDRPAVDGDGRSFVVAWQRDLYDGIVDPDIAARSYSWDVAAGGLLADTGIVVVEATANEAETSPAVAMLGKSALVAYVEQTSATDSDTYVHGLDLYACTACEGRVALPVHAGLDAGPAIGRLSSSTAGANEPAMLIWTAFPTASSGGDVYGHLWTSDDGNVGNMTGGCGEGGRTEASCPLLGNAGFTVRLRDARPSTGAVLVISLNQVGINCGPCRFVADPFHVIGLEVAASDAAGNVALPIPIPNVASLSGQYFFAQWLVSAWGTTPLCGIFGCFLADGLYLQIR